MQVSLGTRRTQTIALASVLLVLYVNGPIVAHADDSQMAVDQCGIDLSLDVYDVCQPQGDNNQSAQDNSQPAPVDVINPVLDLNNQTYYGPLDDSSFYGSA